MEAEKVCGMCDCRKCVYSKKMCWRCAACAGMNSVIGCDYKRENLFDKPVSDT